MIKKKQDAIHYSILRLWSVAEEILEIESFLNLKSKVLSEVSSNLAQYRKTLPIRNITIVRIYNQ